MLGALQINLPAKVPRFAQNRAAARQVPPSEAKHA